MPCRSVLVGVGIPGCLAGQSRGGGWVSQHALQVSPGGFPIFWGGVWSWGEISNFSGGLQFWGGPPFFFVFLISAFFGDTPPPGTRHRNTVKVRPVRILLECILVINAAELLNNPVNDFYAKKSTCCSRVLVVSGTQCNCSLVMSDCVKLSGTLCKDLLLSASFTDKKLCFIFNEFNV